MLIAGGTLERKPMCRWEERGSPGQGDPPSVSWARKPTCGIGTSSGLLVLMREPPSRQLQSITLPRKAVSSQATDQPPTLPLAPHLCCKYTVWGAHQPGGHILRGVLSVGYKAGVTCSDGRSHLSQPWRLDGSAKWPVSWLPAVSVPALPPQSLCTLILSEHSW